MIEKITIKGTEYTLEEARALWQELNDLFGLKVHYPQFTPTPTITPYNPVIPYTPGIGPYRWDSICSDTITRINN